MRCAVGAAGASPSTSSVYVTTSRPRGTRRRGQPAAPSAHRRHPSHDVMMRGDGLRPTTWSARGGHAVDVDRSRGAGIAPSPRQRRHGAAPLGSVAASGGGDWGPLTQRQKDDFPADVPRSTDDLILIAERAVRRYGDLLPTPLYSMQCASAKPEDRMGLTDRSASSLVSTRCHAWLGAAQSASVDAAPCT